MHLGSHRASKEALQIRLRGKLMNRIGMILTASVLLAILPGCGPSTHDLLKQGISQFQTGHPDKAQEILTEVLSREPSNPDALFYMGKIAQSQGQYERAIYYYQCCLDADPSYVEAARLLAQAIKSADPVGKKLQFIPIGSTSSTSSSIEKPAGSTPKPTK